MQYNTIIAPMTFQGSCTTRWFIKWAEKMLIPDLKPGQVVIMDNASFNKSPKVKDLIEYASCSLIYLPPYFSDLNSIEKFLAILKRWINQYLPFMNDGHKTISFFLKHNSFL